MVKRKVLVAWDGRACVLMGRGSAVKLVVWSGVRRAIIKAKRRSNKPFRSIDRQKPAPMLVDLPTVPSKLYLPEIKIDTQKHQSNDGNIASRDGWGSNKPG